MKRVVVCAASLAALFAPSNAGAAAECSQYVGTSVKPLSISSVMKQVSALGTPKDEFETTSAYDARIKKAAASMPATFIIEAPVDNKYVTYNADAQRFEIESYAIGNNNTDYSDVFGYGAPSENLGVEYGLLYDNIDIVMPQGDKRIGTYEGSNAYGVTAKVEKIARTTAAIFERKGEFGEDLFFHQDVGSKRAPIFAIQMAPDKARVLKGEMRSAIVATPKSPYYAVGSHVYEPTIKNPRDIEETIQVMIADITCALWLDPSGHVLAAIATR